MTKIGISTIFKCYNYGSFFQAFAFQQYLKSLGLDVSFLPTDCLYNQKKRREKQYSRNFSLMQNIFSLRRHIAYNKDWEKLVVGSATQKYDYVFIGSDELWNIQNRSFYPDPRYYGIHVNCPCFAYAPCVGKSTVADFSIQNSLLHGIRSMCAWSARDEATYDFLQQLDPKRQIVRVLDPSFLINWHLYEKETSINNFILVYTYDGDWGFSPKAIEKAKSFSQKVQLPLISVGFYNKWCDKNLICSPLEFLGYLKNASYVLTDTFHGTALSIQYQKQFSVLNDHKLKINSLLHELKLTDVLAGDKSISLLDKCINYYQTNLLLQEKIKNSKAFIKECIDSIIK